MPECAGKDGDGISLEGAQVDCLIARRLHLQADPFESPAGQLNLPTRCQNGAAVGRLDQRVFSGIDGTAQQYDVATARQYPALHRYACAGRKSVSKQQPSCQRVGISHAQARCCKACGVDHGSRAYRYT